MLKPDLFLKMLKYCRRQKTDNETAMERRRDYWHGLLTEYNYKIEGKVKGCRWLGITPEEGRNLVVKGFDMPTLEEVMDNHGVKYPVRRGRNKRRK
jgi:hypothetical protein